MRPSLSRPRIAPVLTVMLLVSAASAAAVQLSSTTAAGWTAYVSATEQRIGRELASPRGFLAMDFTPGAAADRRAVLAGAVMVDEMDTLDARGGAIDVPSARVHHWRGAVLIPGKTVAQVIAQLHDGAPPKQEDVLQSRVLARGPDSMKVYLKLQRTRIITVVYNTEHLVRFTRYGATRATSTSTATRIAEVTDVNTPQERELPAGDDRGFLRRLSAYWRYEEVQGGVIAECESISLSRGVPTLVRPLVDPLIRSAARESMERTLVALRAHFAKA